MTIRTGLRFASILAVGLAGCQGLENFSRSVDETAARIIPTDTTARPAAESGKYQLALKYMDGDGVPQSYTKAAELLREPAAAGDSDAQFLLGMLYWTGRGVQRDDATAVQWFQRSAQQGHLESQFFVGEAYQRGRGVARDDREAARWFTQAAEGGHTGAQYELGISYSTGRGVARNDQTALEWFEKAANLGHAEAQYFAGQSYTNGWGTAVDHAWAARWYGKAAEQGLAKAQYMLGVAYATGLGLPTDKVAGYAWLSLAAKQNNPDAIRLRDALGSKLARADIERATARAQAWRPASTTQFADPATVRFAQLALASLEFDPGPADGQMGQRTRQAVAAYQAKAGLRADGALSPALVERLKTDNQSRAALAKSPR